LLFNIFDATTTFDILQLGHVQKKVRRENQEAGKIVASKVQNQQLQLQKQNILKLLIILMVVLG